MGTKRNIKFNSNFSMVHCQKKSTTLFKYIQEVSVAPFEKLELINYARPDELLNSLNANVAII